MRRSGAGHCFCNIPNLHLWELWGFAYLLLGDAEILSHLSNQSLSDPVQRFKLFEIDMTDRLCFKACQFAGDLQFDAAEALFHR